MKKNERFTDTYNRYGDLIFWYAKRRLSNEELSKECTQQVFLKYYEHMDVISEEMVKAWLLTCCKNEIIDYFRRIERRKGFENIDAPEVEVHICSQDNAEYVVERLNREAFYTEVLTALRKKNESWNCRVSWKNCSVVGMFTSNHPNQSKWNIRQSCIPEVALKKSVPITLAIYL